ncbi:MAG: hypothetical protein ACFE8E_02110 [Candidatus Hodarchaeota archaeon]
MEDFLKQIQLSEEAIKIYINSLGRKSLSSNELHSIIPTLSQEDFQNVLRELNMIGLLIPITPQKHGIITQYLALPPFNPIINYLANINANLGSIKNQLRQLLTNSLNTVFKDNKRLEVNTIFKATQDMRKDIQEETMIQKQEIEDIAKGIENVRVMEDVLEDLSQTVIKKIQAQFNDLNKAISNINKDIINEIEILELKKHEKEVKMVVEDGINKKINKSIQNFTDNLHKLIEEELKTKIESLNNIIESSLQFRDDFKMLLINTINSFEIKMTTIFDLIKSKNESLFEDLKKFQETIIDNLDSVIKNSVDSVAALNNPINIVMKDYSDFIKPEKIQIDNLWVVNSILKVNEEIQNLITHSKDDLLLIIPKLEDILIAEQFKDISRNLKIKVASSEATTNSSVRKLKEIKTLEYRTLKNESLYVLKSKDSYIIIGVVLTGVKDKFNDFIGIGTNFKPIIDLLAPVVESIWNSATSELYQAPKYISSTKPAKTEKESIVIPSETVKVDKWLKKPPQQEVPLEGSTDINLPQQVQQHSEFMSKVAPKVLDEAAILITNAFNTLIQKLGTLKGEEFSIELQKVANLILENKGFSVTLHKLRSTINRYKEQVDLLTPDDVRQIIEDIEEWKKHLL